MLGPITPAMPLTMLEFPKTATASKNSGTSERGVSLETTSAAPAQQGALGRNSEGLPVTATNPTGT